MEVVEDEVEQGGSRGGRPVQLAGLVDLRARVAGLGDLRDRKAKDQLFCSTLIVGAFA